MDTRLNTLFVGKVLLQYDRLDSTNSQAERLLREGKPAEGTIIFTHDQFSGRGQMGNEWYNDTFKNLTFSIILYPKIQFPKHQFLLNQIISLGVRETLSEHLNKPVKIKWPNDIMVEDRKISGILIQNSISKQSISHSIVGIGINVNQDKFPEGIGKPTSLFIEKKTTEDLMSLLNKLCLRIEQWYLKLKAGNFSEINAEYHLHLYGKDEIKSFKTTDGAVFKGSIHNVLDNGLLTINTSDGMRKFMFKEIAFI